MHIAINAHLLAHTSSFRRAGVSNYVEALLTHLGQIDRENRYTIYTTHGLGAANLGLPANFRVVPSRLPTINPRIRIPWEQLLAPALLRDVPAEAHIACDEVFGPVLVAMPFDDEAHAVALANGTDYGLVAGVWTRDGARQMRMARAVQSGQVFVNNYGAGGGVELPFGGVKHSGHGREKGFEALYGFTILKTVVLRHG